MARAWFDVRFFKDSQSTRFDFRMGMWVETEALPRIGETFVAEDFIPELIVSNVVYWLEKLTTDDGDVINSTTPVVEFRFDILDVERTYACEEEVQAKVAIFPDIWKKTFEECGFRESYLYYGFSEDQEACNG